MRLRHIELFHAIYTTGSITSAAKLLFVSQPSVSKVLAHAEKQLGFSLFIREKGKLIPTAEANMLFCDVDQIYKQLRLIKRMTDNIRQGEKGRINIAISPALGFELIPDAISEFHSMHPDVQFSVKTLHNDEAQQALLEHRFDLVILFSTPALPGVEEVPLGESEMVIMYPCSQFPDYPSILPVDTLKETDLIGIRDSGPLGELIWNRLADSELDVSSFSQVDTYYIAASLVGRGLGGCTIDRFTAHASSTKKNGVASFDPPIPFQIKALHLESQPLSRISLDFLDLVKSKLLEASPLSVQQKQQRITNTQH